MTATPSGGSTAPSTRPASKSLPQPLTPGGLEDLAARHGTPLYVTSADTVRDRFERLRGAFPGARIQYAAKANTNPRILELLREIGAALDTVSLGEVVAGERAGFAPDRMMYTGTCPSDEELQGVLARGVRVNADAAGDLHRIAAIAPEARVGIRVNPQIGSGHHEHVVTAGSAAKFGIPVERAPAAWSLARELGLVPEGLHMHVGSGILDPEPLVRAAGRLGELARELTREGADLAYVDVGGGLGVPYRPEESPLDIEALAAGMRRALPAGPELIVEPGRYLVAESTVLLVRVTSVKDEFVGVDGGIHTLLRPALYDAYHHVSNLSRPDADHRSSTVVGPICEAGDVLARDRQIAGPRPGDLLALHDVGAYGYAMASRYNSRPLPAEVLVDEGTELIRERETLDDLFARVPNGTPREE